MATRHVTIRPDEQSHRERYLDAALTVLAERGVTALTVRGVAEAAGTSTMSVYVRFGGRPGLLDALYERAFEDLRAVLGELPEPGADGVADLTAVAHAYRLFALDNPSRYALMFERPVPGFDPDPALRSTVVRTLFGGFTARVERVCPPDADARTAAYHLWTTMHGLVGAELMLASRTALPEWFVPPTENANAEIYQRGVAAMTAGLGLRNP